MLSEALVLQRASTQRFGASCHC